MPARSALQDYIRDVNTRYHDGAAGDYDSKWGIDFGPVGQEQVMAKFVKAFGGQFPATFGDALEIGAGTGYFTLNLLQRGSLDRATAHLPRLLHERLDEFGIDFAVLYPSRGLTTLSILDAEVRQVACRALNAFNAEIYFPYADRMTPVAQIPMHTPAEALAELDHAVGALGFKAIMINGVVTHIDSVVPGASGNIEGIGCRFHIDF